LHRPLYHIRNGILTEYKGTLNSIGGFYELEEKVFYEEKIHYQEGDIFYIFSDGYPDQFGGPDERKFSTRQLKDLFVNISGYDSEKQIEILNNTLEEWRGNTKQIDDILIVGIKF